MIPPDESETGLVRPIEGPILVLVDVALEDNADPWMFLRGSDFNPHSREGSDQKTGPGPHPGNHFNPHSREGSDLNPAKKYLIDLQFQSTLPRGE